MDGFLKFLWLLAKIAASVVFVVMVGIGLKFTWDHTYATSAISNPFTPPSVQTAGQTTTAGTVSWTQISPNVRVQDPNRPITSCSVECDGVIIHTIATTDNARCAQFLLNQGQRMCDAHRRHRR